MHFEDKKRSTTGRVVQNRGGFFRKGSPEGAVVFCVEDFGIGQIQFGWVISAGGVQM